MSLSRRHAGEAVDISYVVSRLPNYNCLPIERCMCLTGRLATFGLDSFHNRSSEDQQRLPSDPGSRWGFLWSRVQRMKGLPQTVEPFCLVAKVYSLTQSAPVGRFRTGRF